MANERKKLEELDLLHNFLFGSVITHPDYGEAFSRYLLKVVLGRKIGKLKVIPQSIYYGSDANQHGTVLDVYLEEQLEEPEDAMIYDVEPERNDNVKAVKAIPRRMRYYRAMVDGRGLKSGETYDNLKDLVMIMITPFDPFDMGRMTYTVKNVCLEAPEMSYDDGATMIFLNTKGKPENESEELQQFLRYVENSRLENAVTEDLMRLHEAVERVRHDREVAVRYMRLWESEEIIRQRAMEEGREEGREQGREQGREEGRKRDILELLEALGDVPQEEREYINAEKDDKTLSRILRIAAKSQSIGEYCERRQEICNCDSPNIF